MYNVHNTEPIKLNGMGPFPVHRTTLSDKRSSCMCLNYLLSTQHISFKTFSYVQTGLPLICFK